MKTVAIIAARMGSTRSPGKVMFELGNTKVLQWVVEACYAAHFVDEVWVATSIDPRDDVIEHYCDEHLINCWRGSENDVLKRFADCAERARADVIVRLTGDCPLLDPRVIDEVITLHRHAGLAYANNVDPATWPDGLDVQVVTAAALRAADHSAKRPTDRDTVIEWISRNRLRFPSATLICPIPGLEGERWVMDTAEDYLFLKEIVERLEGEEPSYLKILEILDREPALRAINSMWSRNERFLAQVGNEHG